MKKVITEPRNKEIYIEDLTSESVIGIEWSDGVKSCIFFDGAKKIVTFGNKSVNVLNSNNSTSLETYFNYFGFQKGIYLFETPKDLFKWMSE